MPPTNSPRVGYVVKRYPRYSETFVVNEILAHEEAGLEIEIFSLRPPSDTHFQDLLSRVRAPVTYLTTSNSRVSSFWETFADVAAGCPGLPEHLDDALAEEAADVHAALLLVQHIRKRNLHHLHAHFATSAASVARLASSFAGVPYTLTAHAKDIFHDDVDRDDLGRKLGDAAAVITVSDFNVAHLREEYGPVADRVQRIYNGMRIDELSFADPTRRPPRIISVGRLVEKKGFADLIAACDILKSRGVVFDCEIIGSGELEPALRAMIRDRELEQSVQLLGPRPQKEVMAALQDSSVFAAPCVVGDDGNRDGLPTVLLEAMALGTPCVATDVTGIPEVILHGRTGLIVPQHSPLELADALEGLLAAPDLRAKLAAQARELIEREFDIRRNTAELRHIFSWAAGAGDVNASPTLEMVS